MLTLNRVVVLMAMLLLSGCVNQAIKPSRLQPDFVESHGIIFGSIEYLYDEDRVIGNTFDSYNLWVESVDTGEIHEFSMQELKYDKEQGSTRKALFLRQVPPGTYKLSKMIFVAGYWRQTFTLESPVPFQVRPQEAVYLGNYLTERVGASLGVLGHPKIVISNQLAPDLSFARDFYSDFPQDDRIFVSPAVPSSPKVFEPVKDQ